MKRDAIAPSNGITRSISLTNNDMRREATNHSVTTKPLTSNSHFSLSVRPLVPLTVVVVMIVVVVGNGTFGSTSIRGSSLLSWWFMFSLLLAVSKVLLLADGVSYVLLLMFIVLMVPSKLTFSATNIINKSSSTCLRGHF